MPTSAQPRTPDPLLRLRILLTLTFAAAAIVAAPVNAQTTTGPLANLVVAGTTIGDETDVAIAGGIAYRFNRALAFGIELTSVPWLTPDVPDDIVPIDDPALLADLGALIFPPPVLRTYRFDQEGGRATIFTTNVRLEVPLTSSRVLPYVVAGGGVGTVREEFTLTVNSPDFVIQSLPIVGRPPLSVPITRSSTNVALTLGGGVSFLVTDHVSIDGDLRYVSLLGDSDRHASRFGLGVSYRF